MPIRNGRQIMLAWLVSMCLLSPIGARAQQSPSCQFVSFKVTLNAGDNYERELGGGLLFRVRSQKEPGWFVDIVPAEENTKDYIYPANVPLRFNPNQTLGPGYGETVQSSLSHPHEMNFLLDRTNYERISAVVGNVLHSYQTPDPDQALTDYTNAARGHYDAAGFPIRSRREPLAFPLSSRVERERVNVTAARNCGSGGKILELTPSAADAQRLPS
jgi:hypothetical protein